MTAAWPSPSEAVVPATSLPATFGQLSERMAARAREHAAGRLEVVAARPAASVVLIRDGAEGIELFALRRHVSMAFAGGLLGFPGGSLDEVDQTELTWNGQQPDRWASALGTNPDTARRIVQAAVRELDEETGLNLASAGVVHTDRLHPYSCWTTPVFEPIRFCAWFVLAALQDNEDPVVQTCEASSGGWLNAAQGLRQHLAGRLPMLPPQYFALCDAVLAGSVAELIAGRWQEPVPWVEPQPDFSGELDIVVVPDWLMGRSAAAMAALRQ
jgi:8-oxo-dGTP pyrophosphatase MutT (NUDIX family)